MKRTNLILVLALLAAAMAACSPNAPARAAAHLAAPVVPTAAPRGYYRVEFGQGESIEEAVNTAYEMSLRESGNDDPVGNRAMWGTYLPTMKIVVVSALWGLEAFDTPRAFRDIVDDPIDTHYYPDGGVIYISADTQKGSIGSRLVDVVNNYPSTIVTVYCWTETGAKPVSLGESPYRP